MPAYLKIKLNELKLPSLGACVPFPVSLSGNPWVLLYREGSPKVASNSRIGHFAELVIYPGNPINICCWDCGILILTVEVNHLLNSHVTLLEESTAHYALSNYIRNKTQLHIPVQISFLWEGSITEQFSLEGIYGDLLYINCSRKLYSPQESRRAYWRKCNHFFFFFFFWRYFTLMLENKADQCSVVDRTAFPKAWRSKIKLMHLFLPSTKFLIF